MYQEFIMKNNRFLILGIVIVGTMLFVFSNTSVALASTSIPGDIYQDTEPVDPPEGLTLEGTVVAIDDEAGTLEVEVLTESGEIVLYTIQMPEGFDFSTITEGDTVDVASLLSEEGTGLISDPEEETGGFYCENQDATHPTGSALSETYGVTYEEVMDWFCGSAAAADEGGDEGEAGGEGEEGQEGEDASEHKIGFGQIMLALQTAESSDESVDELLARRAAGEGWGQIWNDLDDQGDQGDDTGETGDGEDTPEDSESGDEESDDKGKPDHAGPKDDKGKDKDKDKENKKKDK